VESTPRAHRIGWIGVGNMGRPLVTRLLEAGHDVTVYNRTRAKAEPLGELGATIVDTPAELAGTDIVFTVVSGPDDFKSVVLGERGLLSGEGAPELLVDCSTISLEASQAVREAAAAQGTALLAAPISGNGEVVASGAALFAVSGPEDAFGTVRPYLDAMGRGSHYVGEGDAARIVKIAHNLVLGAVNQSLVETCLLTEAAGVDRAGYLEFLNDSALGSRFTGYKTPALNGLDWTPTFNCKMLRKDLDLGLEVAAQTGARLPVTELARDLIQAAIDAGRDEEDFAVLLEVQAAAAGIALEPTGDGLVRER